MKLSCPLTGVNYSTDAGTGSARAIHPIFQIPVMELVKSNLPAMTAGQMSTVDIHLFGAAILRSLPIDRWSCPLAAPALLRKLWEAQIVPLVTVSGRLDNRTLQELPHYTIDKQTATLENLPDYLVELNKAIDDAARIWDGVHDSRNFNLSWTTDQIYKIIRDTQQKAGRRRMLPQLLSNWATAVGNFPFTDMMIDTVDDKGVMTVQKIVTRTYWRQSIIQAAQVDKLPLVTWAAKESLITDYEELIAHCEAVIPYGSLHADILLDALRGAVDTLKEFKPKIVSATDWILDQKAPPAELLGVSEAEPIIAEVRKPTKAEPRRNEYRNSLEFLKARLEWQKAMAAWAAYQRQLAASKPVSAEDL